MKLAIEDGPDGVSGESVGSPGIRLILSLLAMLFAILGPLLHTSEGGLGYDEGDYYRAVSNGFLTNWTDRDDIPASEFIAAGMRAVQGNAEKGELSRAIRASGSTAFYRHFHPPVAFYPSMIIRTVAPDLSPEQTLRVASIIFMVGWILVILALSRWRPSVFPWTIALLPATAHYIQSAAAFNMHIPFGLATLGMFLCWRAYTRSDRDDLLLRRATLIFFGVALCAVEYSLVLLSGAIMWGLFQLWSDRDHLRSALGRRMVDGLWVVGTILITWPGGIFNLGLLKSYAHQAYIALFRLKDVPSGFSSPIELVAGKFSPSPLDLLLLLVGLAVVIIPFRRLVREGYRAVSLLLLVAILILQLNPSLVLPWYTFPLFAVALVLYLSEGKFKAILSRNSSVIVAIGLPAITFAVALVTVTVESDSFVLDMKGIVEERIPKDVPIIADQTIVPGLGGYFLTREIIGYHTLEIPGSQRRDSVEAWQSRGAALILPIEFGLQGHDTVGDYVLLFPNAKSE